MVVITGATGRPGRLVIEQLLGLRVPAGGILEAVRSPDNRSHTFCALPGIRSVITLMQLVFLFKWTALRITSLIISIMNDIFCLFFFTHTFLL